MASPQISIIVPVYNVEKFLRACLDSIIGQTFTDFEAVLVDDGSTDCSGIICDEYAAKDNRIVVVHKQNEGVAKARITAFEHSKGEYVTFIDADDFVDLHYLEIMMNTATKYQVDMVGCRYYIYQEGKVIETPRRITGYYNRTALDRILQTQFLYDKNTNAAAIPIFLWSKIVRREYVHDSLKIGEGLKWSEDTTALFHLIIHVQSFYEIEDCLYYYVKRPGQATSIYSTEMLKNQLDAYRRYQQIDVNGLLQHQYHIRTWLFGIKKTIFHKMPIVIRDHSSFVKELKRLEKHPSWKDFFSHNSTFLDWRNNSQFWILKLRMYSLFYFIYYRRTLKRLRYE